LPFLRRERAELVQSALHDGHDVAHDLIRRGSLLASRAFGALRPLRAFRAFRPLRAFWAFRPFRASLAGRPLRARHELDRGDLAFQLHPDGLDVRAERACVGVLVHGEQVDEQSAEPPPEIEPLFFREHFSSFGAPFLFSRGSIVRN
jgi:hypothetical protein